jgi:hypothetical protein
MTVLIGEANNVYYNVPATGSNGSDATFDVSRDNVGDIQNIVVVKGGYDYNVGETLTIDGANVGGSSGTDDIRFTISNVAGSTGSANNFFGSYAGFNNISGEYNNFFGSYAGRDNTTGSANNFFGVRAGYYNTTGGCNNFFGSCAGRYNTTGNYNNFFGFLAGRGRKGIINTIGITTFTTLVGEADNSYSNVPVTGGDGSNATFIVYRDSSGDVNIVNTTTPGYNYNVGNTLTIDGSDVGGSSGTDDITITVDAVVGSTGINNNFFGKCAGQYNTSGSGNNFFGNAAGRCNTTGCYNNFFGYIAGRDNTTGKYNNFFGPSAGRYNTTGCNNNFFGRCAGYYNTTGNYNNFFGFIAGRSNTTGNSNNFLGYYAGSSNTTGTHNTFLGSWSGISTSSSDKIILGRGNANNQRFDAPDPTKDTQFAVGIRTDANPANYWLVGDENFNVGIGTTSPQYKLDVGGDAKISDIRISGTQIIGGGSTLGSIQLIPNETLTGQGQYVNLRPTTNLDQTHIHIEAGNVNIADLYLGDDDRFVKIDHTGPVVIGVPSTATTSNWTAPSGDGPIGYIVIDMDVYPWAQYLTLGDTVTLPDTTVVNIINNSLSSNSMSVYFESNISYSTSDILVFSYTPRTEWKFNSDSSAIFPGYVGIGTTRPTTNLDVGGTTRVRGFIESQEEVSNDTDILSLNGANGTVFTHTTTSQIGIVSFSGISTARAGTQTFSVIVTQGSTPVNITPTTGIGTQLATIVTEDGVGYSTHIKVGSGTTLTLTNSVEAIDLLTFMVSYDGNTSVANTSFKVIGLSATNFRGVI